MATEPITQRMKEEGRTLTLLEHLQELRYRLMVSAGAVLLATAASFVVTRWALEFLVQPAKDANQEIEIIFTEPLEYVATYFRVSLLLGIAMAMPILVYQVLAFVGPGLTRDERRWLYPIVLSASASFLAGAAFAYYVELPPALRFLFNFGGGVAQPNIKVGSYIDFVTRFLLVNGLVFEMPLFVMGLAKLGIVTSRKLLGWWRYAIVLAFVLAAVVTPTIDPVTQSMVAGPIIVLFFLGILLARLVERNPLLRGFRQ